MTWTNISRKRSHQLGRITAMAPLAGLAALLCVGIAVDFSGQTYAEQQLRNTAGFCARQGSQAVTMSTRSSVRTVEVTSECLRQHHLTGAVDIEGSTLIVSVEGTYTTQLLSIIGVNTLPVNGRVSTEILPSR